MIKIDRYSENAVQLAEGRKEYMAKYAGEKDVKAVVDEFWQIKGILHAPENDIDWWIRKPFSDLKNFVADAGSAPSKQKRRQDQHADEARKYGAVFLGRAGGYEVWYIPSHEAAVQIGRLYKGKSASWCISTDNPEFFCSTYSDREFVFMIGDADRQALSKLALEIDGSGQDARLLEVWDADDVCLDSDGQGVWIYAEEALDLFKDSGLSRSKYEEERAARLVSDQDWVRKTIFGGAAEPNSDGSWTAKFPIKEIAELTDDGERYRKILEEEYEDVFEAPYDVSYDIGAKAERAFNEYARPHGMSWNDVAAAAQDEDVGGSVGDWIRKNMDDDFFEEAGYDTTWRDCWTNGTGAEARFDVLGQLRASPLGVVSCDYSGDATKLVCLFPKEAVLRMAKRATNQAERMKAPELACLDEYGEIEKVEITEPYYGWSGFDEDYMAEAAGSFGKRFAAYMRMQKDAPGQMFFGFDRPDNPENL